MIANNNKNREYPYPFRLVDDAGHIVRGVCPWLRVCLSVMCVCVHGYVCASP